MNRPIFAALAALVLAGPLTAGPYEHLLGGVRKHMPHAGLVGVVCDAANAQAAISELSAAAGGMKLLVVDAKSPQDLGKAMASLGSRRPDFVVLIKGDRVAGDGTAGAGFLIQRLAVNKIPVVSITEDGLRQGALFGLAKGQLSGNPKAAAALSSKLPDGIPAI